MLWGDMRAFAVLGIAISSSTTALAQPPAGPPASAAPSAKTPPARSAPPNSSTRDAPSDEAPATGSDTPPDTPPDSEDASGAAKPDGSGAPESNGSAPAESKEDSRRVDETSAAGGGANVNAPGQPLPPPLPSQGSETSGEGAADGSPTAVAPADDDESTPEETSPAATPALQATSPGAARTGETASFATEANLDERDAVSSASHPPAPAVATTRGRRGFYARLSAGWGSYSEFMKTADPADYGGRILAQTIGISGAGELSFGGGLTPCVVLGGGLFTTNLLASTVRVDTGSPIEPPPELDPPLRATALLGPFVNWYVGSEPDVYLQAALGVASIARTPVGGAASDSDYRAFGAGVLLGVGAEWPLGRDFSVGITGRISALVARGRDDTDASWLHVVTSAPAVLATLTYY